MKRDYRSKLIAIATLFFMTGIVGTRPLIPLLSNEIGASTFEIGVIIACFSVLPLFLAVKLGHWVDKVGQLLPLLISTVFGAVAMVLPFIFDNLSGVYISQLIGGVSQTIFALSAQSFVSYGVSGNRREKNISIFSMGVAGGGFIGPFLSGYLADLLGFSITIALFSSVILIAFLIILRIYIQVQSKLKYKSIRIQNSRQTEDNLIYLLKNKNLRKAILISMLILLAKDLYLYYFPLLANNIGFSATAIGVIIGLHNGAGILIRWFLIKLIVKWGKSEVIVASILLSGLFLGLLPLTDTLIISAIISILLGAMLGIGQPLSISSTVNYSPEYRTGQVLGLRLTFNRFTQFTSPIIFGGIASLFNLASIFIIVAIILGIGSTQSFIRGNSRQQDKN
ncbi:MFS transporter [Virgibacillus oceani]